MLKLYFQEMTVQGWKNREVDFAAGEGETAVQMGRELKASNKVRGVRLHDFSLPRSRKRIAVLEDVRDFEDESRYTARQVGTVLVTQPACVAVALEPQARKPQSRKVAVTQEAAFEPAPPVAKPVRRSKRERAFGKAAR